MEFLKQKLTSIPNFEREDALKEFWIKQGQSKHIKKRVQTVSSSADQNFSFLNQIKLNKGKKQLLEEERNTEIERSNRILHEKLTKCASRSVSYSRGNIDSISRTVLMDNKKHKSVSKKLKTSPTLPEIDKKKYKKKEQAMTLFMGHSPIDGVDFKIKILISSGTYFLIAQNEHTKIVLQMPEEEYWQLHYRDLQENPCYIFQYLKIEKGQISFKTKTNKKARRKQKLQKLPTGIVKKEGELKLCSEERQQNKIN